jgi:hypothetical protein
MVDITDSELNYGVGITGKEPSGSNKKVLDLLDFIFHFSASKRLFSKMFPSTNCPSNQNICRSVYLCL